MWHGISGSGDDIKLDAWKVQIILLENIIYTI